jgi:Predicted nucleic acid-binding protein, contains PIN domain
VNSYTLHISSTPKSPTDYAEWSLLNSCADSGWTALDAFRRLGMTRYPVFSLLDRVWELRDNLSAYDASYVALAELLDCNLLTADARLSRAPGIRCSITLVPR